MTNRSPFTYAALKAECCFIIKIRPRSIAGLCTWYVSICLWTAFAAPIFLGESVHKLCLTGDCSAVYSRPPSKAAECAAIRWAAEAEMHTLWRVDVMG